MENLILVLGIISYLLVIIIISYYVKDYLKKSKNGFIYFWITLVIIFFLLGTFPNYSLIVSKILLLMEGPQGILITFMLFGPILGAYIGFSTFSKTLFQFIDFFILKNTTNLWKRILKFIFIILLLIIFKGLIEVNFIYSLIIYFQLTDLPNLPESVVFAGAMLLGLGGFSTAIATALLQKGILIKAIREFKNKEVTTFLGTVTTSLKLGSIFILTYILLSWLTIESLIILFKIIQIPNAGVEGQIPLTAITIFSVIGSLFSLLTGYLFINYVKKSGSFGKFLLKIIAFHFFMTLILAYIFGALN